MLNNPNWSAPPEQKITWLEPEPTFSFAEAVERLKAEWIAKERVMAQHRSELMRERPGKERWRSVLLDTADLLERRGWIQHMSENYRGICVGQALNYVARGADAGEATTMMQRYLNNPSFPVGWNDAPGRTRGEVTRALRSCALTYTVA